MKNKPLPALIAALALSACQPAPPPENPAPAAPHNLILYYHGDHTDALRREIAAYGAEILSTIRTCTASPSASPPTKPSKRQKHTSAACQTSTVSPATKYNNYNKAALSLTHPVKGA